MIKAFKYRIYPTDEQKTLLDKHFGSSRFVYNYYLNERKQSYLDGKKLNYYDNSKSLTLLKKKEEYNWLTEVGSQSIQQSLRNLEVSYQNFFQKRAKFPVFHKKHQKQTFRVPQSIKINDNKIFVPKFTEGIIINLHRDYQGDICYATFSKSKVGKYYVSITCDNITQKAPIKSDKAIGLDLGIKSLITCSDDTTYENKKYYHNAEKELKYLNRQLHKKTKGRKNRNRARLKIAQVYEKIINQKQDYLHKISSKLITENQIICIEDLNVSGMLRNHKLAKSIQNCSWSMFTAMLKYKAEWNKREIIEVGRFFPSSKTCSNCGFIKEQLGLEERSWICPKCKEQLGRDVNAAKNILKQGLNLKSGLGTKSDLKQKHVEALAKVFPKGKRIVKSKKHEATGL